MPDETVDAYNSLFSRNLHGCWDNAEVTFSPADTSLSFNRDGTAHCMNGAGGLLTGGFQFKWRQIGDFEIEVSADGETWSKVGYAFYMGVADLMYFPTNGVHICFEPVDSSDELLGEFCYTFLPLACR